MPEVSRHEKCRAQVRFEMSINGDGLASKFQRRYGKHTIEPYVPDRHRTQRMDSKIISDRFKLEKEYEKCEKYC